MSLFSKIFGAEKSQDNNNFINNDSKNETAAAQMETEDNANNGELIAVIMAALMNMLSDEVSSELKIKSIRRIGRNTPVWNIAGREEYIASKL